MKRGTLSFFILVLWAASALAAWKIEARRLTVYHDRRVAVAEGQVVITGKGLTIFASRARYEMETKRLWLSGPVKILTLHGDWLKGRQAFLDLRSGEGRVDGALLFIQKDRVRVRARRLERLSEDRYVAYRAVITTCEMDCEKEPSWSFRARKVVVSEGYARGRWVSFWVKRLPLAASPYLSLPVKRRRKSGFLFPRLVTGSRTGAGVEVPLFLALHDSFDLTLSPLYTGKRGLLFSAEGRWRVSRDARGLLRYRYLHDRLEDKDYNGDGIRRGNQSRYWITARVDQPLAQRIALHLDLDLLSDRDFLEEFEGGPFGFSETHRQYLEWFGRGLEERNQTYRTSRLWLDHLRENTYLEASGTYRDAVLPGRQPSMLSPLGDLYFRALRRPLFGPLHFDFSLDSTYWYREEGSRGLRTEVVPEISLEQALGPLETQVAYRFLHTRYDVDWDNGTTEDLTRTLYEIEARASLEFYRIYGTGPRRFRHSLRPYLHYFYRPPENQEDFPLWRAEDRLPPAHWLEYGLLQFVTLREEPSPGRLRYRDLLRFKLYQRYDFREATRELSAAEEERRPFSNLIGELEFQSPGGRLSLRYDAEYNFYGLGLARQELTLSLTRVLLDRFSLGYQRDRLRQVKQLNLSGSWRFLRRFVLHGALSRNLLREETSSASLGLTYEASCYSVDLTLGITPEETRFSFWINLLGVGGYGRTY
ncbi:LPS-assembly protein LptD [Thermosulfurimonas marina]|uniref:LPS-assembly protein LptD n=1 Tax=Thermosulfurimonas marina TaxID=2047767 RepID=A0A6H1WT91_9BACT|nr:LPS assembly protein LptD [Thermosulfurimonas marina]QJA06390.1 LPS-assembly protein LptD [Thermosulfurimonas marina]